jgi:hypothetical protein
MTNTCRSTSSKIEQTVLCRYVTSVHADPAAEITFPSTFSPTS